MTPWADAVLASTLPSVAKMVGLHLEETHGTPGAGRQIAQQLNLATAQAYNAINRLEHGGWIKVDRTSRPHTYILSGPAAPRTSPPRDAPSSSEWMTPREASRHLGFASTAQVYEIIDLGHLAGYRLGGRIQVRTTEVLDFLDSG